MADWIASRRCQRGPRTRVRCADPFHVVAWAIEALDVERRRAWNQASGRNTATNADLAARTRPRHLARHRSAPATHSGRTPKISPRTNAPSSTGSPRPTPDSMRGLPTQRGPEIRVRRQGRRRQARPRPMVVSWARRSRMPCLSSSSPARSCKHRAAIDHALDSGLSNGLIESTNTKIRLLTRIAFGFHGPEPLIALSLLAVLGSHPPVLPGRT